MAHLHAPDVCIVLMYAPKQADDAGLLVLLSSASAFASTTSVFPRFTIVRLFYFFLFCRTSLYHSLLRYILGAASSRVRNHHCLHDPCPISAPLFAFCLPLIQRKSIQGVFSFVFTPAPTCCLQPP